MTINLFDKMIEKIKKLPDEKLYSLMDYLDFLAMQKKRTTNSKSNACEINKLIGKIKELLVDPLDFQEQIRNEW